VVGTLAKDSVNRKKGAEKGAKTRKERILKVHLRKLVTVNKSKVHIYLSPLPHFTKKNYVLYYDTLSTTCKQLTFNHVNCVVPQLCSLHGHQRHAFLPVVMKIAKEALIVIDFILCDVQM